jgi:hypothetical protein
MVGVMVNNVHSLVDQSGDATNNGGIIVVVRSDPSGDQEVDSLQYQPSDFLCPWTTRILVPPS